MKKLRSFLPLSLFALFLAVTSVLAQNEPPPPPEFKTGLLKFRLTEVAPGDGYTCKGVCLLSDPSAPYAVGDNVEIFAPSDSQVESNIAPGSRLSRLRVGKTIEVTRFMVLSNDLIAANTVVKSGLVVSTTKAGGQRGKAVADPDGLSEQASWGELKAAAFDQ